MMNCGIYSISSANGQYIGSSINLKKRRYEHFRALRKGSHKNRLLQNAFEKHGEFALQFRTLLICAPSDLLMYEQRAIDGLRPRYNLSPVTGSTLGLKWSEESRRRKAEQTRGIKQSNETRQRRAATMAGHAVSEETRARISAAQKGKPRPPSSVENMRGRKLSPEHIQRLRDSHVGKPSSRLGAVIPQEMRDRISAKLKGRPRSAESRAKQSATLTARRAAL